MANLPETPQWEDGVYQIEVSDPVLGGPDGISNRQAKQLASRTTYLKQKVEKGGTDLTSHIAAADPHPQYAPKASPVFTGTPTAPTPAVNDNSKKLVTTEFVARAIAALAGTAPETLDTLKELADALGNDPNFATTMTNALAGKMDKAKNGGDIQNVATFIANLGLGTAATKNVGTGAGQIPDMSAWSFVKNADSSKWTLSLPNGFLLQKCSVVTPGAAATVNAVWLIPFPIECLGVWGVDGSSGVADLSSTNVAQLPAGRIYTMGQTTTYAPVGGYGGIDIYAIGH